MPLKGFTSGASSLQRFTFAILPTLLALSLGLVSTQPSHAVVGPGESPVQLRFAAMDALLHGNSKDALDLYDTAIQESIQQYGESSTFLADLYYEAGTVALESSQFPAAEHYLTRAVKINPYSTMAKIKLAELYRLQIKPAEASRQFRQAVQINPNSPVTRHAYVRWLAANGSTSQENAIATQESLKLALLNAQTNEINRVRDNKGTHASPVRLAPPLIAPLGKGAPAEANLKPATDVKPATKSETEKISESEKPDQSKSGTKPKAVTSLFPFKDVNKASILEKEKAQKHEQELAKQEAAKKDAARKDAIAREAGARAAAEREAALRRELKAAQAKIKQSQARKPAKVETAAVKAKPETKPVEAKAVEKTADAEPKKVEAAKPAKIEKVEKVAQPNIVPSAQPMYQQPMMYQPMPMPMMQVQQPPKTKKAGRTTMVPPPPPTMPMYPPMQMMRPQMQPYPQPQPQMSAPPPKPKKVTPKPVKEEPAEQPEEKPAVIPQSSEPDFLIDWGGGGNKKKGK